MRVSLASMQPSAASTASKITNEALGPKAATLLSDFGAFIAGLNVADYAIKSASSATGTFTPDLAFKNFEIFRIDVQKEISALNNLALSLVATDSTLRTFDFAQTNSLLSSLERRINVNIETARVGLNISTKRFDVDWTSNAGLSWLIIVVVIFSVLLIAFVVFLYMNVEKNKWLWGRLVNYAILLIKTILTILVLAFAGASIAISQLVNFLCYAGPKMMEDLKGCKSALSTTECCSTTKSKLCFTEVIHRWR